MTLSRRGRLGCSSCPLCSPAGSVQRTFFQEPWPPGVPQAALPPQMRRGKEGRARWLGSHSRGAEALRDPWICGRGGRLKGPALRAGAWTQQPAGPQLAETCRGGWRALRCPVSSEPQQLPAGGANALFQAEGIQLNSYAKVHQIEKITNANT